MQPEGRAKLAAFEVQGMHDPEELPRDAVGIGPAGRAPSPMTFVSGIVYSWLRARVPYRPAAVSWLPAPVAPEARAVTRHRI